MVTAVIYDVAKVIVDWEAGRALRDDLVALGLLSA